MTNDEVSGFDVVRPVLTVGAFLRDAPPDLTLKLLGGAKGLRRRLTSPRIQKLGLALAGFGEFVHRGRLQIIGETEVAYLSTLAATERSSVVQTVMRMGDSLSRDPFRTRSGPKGTCSSASRWR